MKKTTLKNEIGNRYGKLLVIERAENNTHSQAQWLCKCDCSNKATVNGGKLRSGHTKSCGCLVGENASIANTKDEIGNKYGRLVIIEKAKSRYGVAYWKCRCECRNVVVVQGRSLRRGVSQSCGCLHKEVMSGENNHKWKGGVSPVNRLLRTSDKYEKWRQAVFKRDDYTCQSCRKRGIILNAHHIVPFRKVKNDEKLLWDIENGLTLCRECHKQIRKKEGNKMKKQQIISIHD